MSYLKEYSTFWKYYIILYSIIYNNENFFIINIFTYYTIFIIILLYLLYIIVL